MGLVEKSLNFKPLPNPFQWALIIGKKSTNCEGLCLAVGFYQILSKRSKAAKAAIRCDEALI